MMRRAPAILCVNPWIHDFAAYDFWSKPLGLLSLASVLRACGCAVFYIDCTDRFHPRAPAVDPFSRHGRGPYLKTPIARPAGLEDVRRTFSRYGIAPEWFAEDLRNLPARPDLVLVTSIMTYWYPGVAETIEMIRRVFPEYGPGWLTKITIPSKITEKDTFNFFNVTIENEAGESKSKRMPLDVYLQVVAASNLKQRLRMTTLYYHAEKRNWAVAGTGNKDEHMQGFFVKYGDGGADLKPIAHLFKVQVYQLAEYLGVPEEIIRRTPTTDTYSAEVTQEEFFFGLDFEHMDLLWYAMENKVPAKTAAKALGMTPEQVERAYFNIDRKIKATEYLRMEPLEVKVAKKRAAAVKGRKKSK